MENDFLFSLCFSPSCALLNRRRRRRKKDAGRRGGVETQERHGTFLVHVEMKKGKKENVENRLC